MNPNISRRNFLAGSAALATGAIATGTTLPCFADKKPAKYHGLPMGIQSYTLRNFDTEQAIRHIKGLGLQYAEFYTKHLGTNASPKQIAEVIDRLKEAGIKMNAHGVHNFTKDHDKNRQLFEFAKAADIKTITANPQADSFDSLDKLVEEYQIRIAIHNHGPGALYDGLKNVQDRVKDRHALIGACVDTGHVLRSNEDPVAWIKALGPRVYALHIKDVAEKQNKTHDVIIGQGHLDVVGMFTAMKEINFPADGVISMEYEDRPENPIADVRDCLDVAEAAIAKVWG